MINILYIKISEYFILFFNKNIIKIIKNLVLVGLLNLNKNFYENLAYIKGINKMWKIPVRENKNFFIS